MAKLSGNAPTNYIGKGTAFPNVCAVCHDPHNKTNSHQLRAPIDNPDITVNLCTSCHVRGTLATPSFTINSRGAHASQGAVYFGEGAGWIPPGFVFDPNNPVQTSHVTANPRLCAGCHVSRFTTTDQSTGKEFTSVGHLFSPNPCKDPVTGLPIGPREPGGDCAFTATARFWKGCVNAGCHADENAAANLFNGIARRGPGADRRPVEGLEPRYGARHHRRRPAPAGAGPAPKHHGAGDRLGVVLLHRRRPRTTACRSPRARSSTPACSRRTCLATTTARRASTTRRSIRG